MPIFAASWKISMISPSSILCLTAVIMVSTSTNTFSSNYNCNFDKSICSWFNIIGQDDFNWKRGSRADGRQKGSGTNDDHGGGGGYVYIKSRNRNRTAKLVSPPFALMKPSCLDFWYYMKGRTLGHLEVNYARSRATLQNNNVLWNLRGHQGNEWKNAKVPLVSKLRGVLIIEAFDWNGGRSGNILVDDISLTIQTSACSSIQPPEADPNNQHNATTMISQQTNSHVEVASTQGYKTLPLLEMSSAAQSKFVIPTAAQSKSVIPTSTLVTSAEQARATVQKTSVTTSSTANNSTGMRNTPPVKAAKGKNILIIAIVSVLAVIVVLMVALLIYFRRKKKQANVMYADDCSVIMTRMYPENTTAPSLEYRKFN